MSTATLTGLRDYLYDTLSTADMMWLVEEMKDHIRNSEERIKPYTMEELNAMLDLAEADIAAGRTIPDEEVWRRYDERRTREEQEEHELAEAV